MSDELRFRTGSQTSAELCTAISRLVGDLWAEAAAVAGRNSKVQMSRQEDAEFAKGELAVRFSLDIDADGIAGARFELMRGEAVERVACSISPRPATQVH